MQAINAQFLPLNLTGDHSKINWKEMSCFEYKNMDLMNKNLILLKISNSKSTPKFQYEQNEKDDLF